MQINKVADTKEALEAALLELISSLNDKKLINIAFTGGRFGKTFLMHLNKMALDLRNASIYLTDERITNQENEKNSTILLPILRRLENFNHNTFFDFSEPNLNKFNFPKNLDLCFLSLGEDGHLAGDFFKSKNLNNFICHTDQAPKPPRKRISFRADWLFKSKKIILIVLGKSKKNAFKKLICGNGYHSKSFLKCSNEIIIITDII